MQHRHSLFAVRPRIRLAFLIINNELPLLERRRCGVVVGRRELIFRLVLRLHRLFDLRIGEPDQIVQPFAEEVGVTKERISYFLPIRYAP